jgi:hypothetical protein
MAIARPAQVPSVGRQLERYLRTLTGAKPVAQLLEIRFGLRRGEMGRVFLAAHSAAGATRFIRRLAGRTDVYVGVALRGRRSGGRDAVAGSHLAFVEIDSPDAQHALARFPHAATMVIASGTPGHLHAYWALRAPVSVPVLERANRRLAHHLGGDLASVDAARILRPPESLNHKHRPPAAVELLAFDQALRYDVDELVDALPDPPGRPRRSRPSQRRAHHELDDALLAIPAADYVAALTGLQPTRAGKVNCPFHEDHTPSLQLYEDGSWYCFGACGRGGTIYDFAAQLWGIGTKRREFLELRARLADELAIAAGT